MDRSVGSGLGCIVSLAGTRTGPGLGPGWGVVDNRLGTSGVGARERFDYTAYAARDGDGR